MTPANWLKKLRDAVVNRDWDAFASLRKDTNQGFANTLDSGGLRAFYTEALRSLPSEKAARLLEADDAEFRADIRAALANVRERISADPNIKGVYFEYYFDGTGDESNAGNFFLCETFSDSDDSWGSEFGEDGFVEGAMLPRYFFFDRHFEWDDVSHKIADEAANGRLLAAVLEEWNLARPEGIPLGFANHDHEMIRVVV